MAKYAEGTSVTPDRSLAEISETLRRYGATGFAYGWEDDRAMIAFRAHERQVRFILDLPKQADQEFALTPTGRQRDTTARTRAYEAEMRRRWRALALAIKAKLEVVESGIATFEEEFLAHLVLPSGETVAQRVVPELDAAWQAGVTPARLLPQIEA